MKISPVQGLIVPATLAALAGLGGCGPASPTPPRHIPAAQVRPVTLVVPPGRESLVVELVGTSIRAAGLAPNVDISIDSSTIRFGVGELAHEGQAPPRIAVGYAGTAIEAGTPLGDAISIDCRAPCPPDVMARAAPLAEQLRLKRAALQDRIWTAPTDPSGHLRAPPSEPEPRLSGVEDVEREIHSRWREVREYADGPALFVLLAMLVLWLARRVSGEEASEVTGPLLAITAVAAVVRLVIPLAVAQEPWPYTREPAMLITISHQSWSIAAIAQLLGRDLWVTDVTFNVQRAFAILTPMAVFVHARSFWRSSRWALVAAAIIAVLPMHIRFSASEVKFIPSMVVSSVGFGLVYVTLRDRNIWIRVAALVTLGLSAPMVFTVRPLNILFVPVMVAAVWWLDGNEATLARKIAASVVLLLGGVWALETYLLAEMPAQVSEGLSLSTVERGLAVLFDPRLNTLVNPWITPPLLTLFAVLGGISAWRDGEHRRLFYLLGWVLLFLVADAYVVPESSLMQARYHLDLVAPFVLLAAPTVVRAWTWRPWSGWAVAVYLLLAPLMHLDFERELDRHDIQEWTFVESFRTLIPEGCTVLEYTATGFQQPRTQRIGAYVRERQAHQRWRVVGTDWQPPASWLATPNPAIWWASDAVEQVAPGDVVLGSAARAVIDDPPECLFVYEGVPCYAVKTRAGTIAPPCAALHERLTLTPVATRTVRTDAYDNVLNINTNTPLDTMDLVLYRAAAKSAVAAP